MPDMRSLSRCLIEAPPIFIPVKRADKINKLIISDKINMRHKWMLALCSHVFSNRELITSNCTGSAGCEKLNQQKLLYICQLVFYKFPCHSNETEVGVWKTLCTKIDLKHQNLKRDAKIKLKFE